MSILPLIKRELRVRSRGPALYWTRFATALVGTLICLLGLAIDRSGISSSGQGKGVFDGLVGLLFFLNCMMGLVTVDAISRERREGTLGLLFLTHVNSLEVLLGKFGAAGLTGLCSLAALFPVLIIPVLAGGVTGGEALRKGLVLVDVLILSLAVGLWASTSGREWLRMAGKALGFLAALLFGPPLMEGLILHGSNSTGVALISPLALMMQASDAAYKSSETAYWVGLFAELAVAWWILLEAGRRLHRSAMDQEATPQKQEQEKMLTRRTLGPSEEPVEYLMRRQQGIRAMIWTATILGAVYHIPMLLLIFRWNSRITAQAGWLALILVQGPLFAWAACRFFIETRRSGELELLLTTPSGSRNIVCSQWKVLRRYFLWPLVLMIAPILIRFIQLVWLRDQPRWDAMVGISYLLAIVNMVGQIAAICWMGLWFGYKARGQVGAIVKTVLLVNGVPFLLSQLGTIILMTLIASRLPPRGVPWIASLTIQLAVLASYVWMICFAMRRLKQELPGAQGLKIDVLGRARKVIRWLRTWPRPMEESGGM